MLLIRLPPQLEGDGLLCHALNSQSNFLILGLEIYWQV